MGWKGALSGDKGWFIYHKEQSNEKIYRNRIVYNNWYM